MENLFEVMMRIRDDSRTRRISSWDKTGGNRDFVTIPAGDSAAIAEMKGPGCINHLYMTIHCPDRNYLRLALLRMYWDDENIPSVEVPVGDFFGVGHCKVRGFRSLLLCVNPGALTPGFNSYFPMPFSEKARIEVVNECEVPINALWYHVDYEERNKIDSSLGRFHAQWRRENPCEPVDQPASPSWRRKERGTTSDLY
jgi:hypothetical protein